MIIPKKHKIWLTFIHNDTTYRISSDIFDRSIYFLYRKVSEEDYTQLGTSNNPARLEEKVYDGKYS